MRIRFGKYQFDEEVHGCGRSGTGNPREKQNLRAWSGLVWLGLLGWDGHSWALVARWIYPC